MAIVGGIRASKPYQRAYRKLPSQKKQLVDRTIRKLMTNPELPGLHVEKVRAASDNIRSIRVSGSLRLIVEIGTEGIRLRNVAEHDEAYRRAVAYWLGPAARIDDASGVESSQDEEEFMMVNVAPLVDEHALTELRTVLDEAGIEPSRASDLLGMIRSLIEETLSDGTDGRAKPDHYGNRASGGWINVIPSDARGPCEDLLVAFCFDADSFDNRLREVAYHAGIHCPNTKAVVLISSKWDPNSWKKNHEGAFASLDAHVLAFLVGPRGLVRTI